MKNQIRKRSSLSTAITLVLLSSAPLSSVQAASKYWSVADCGSSWWDYNCWSPVYTGALDGLGQPIDSDFV